MAWIESHQTLAHHPKTKRLARALGVSVPTVIGHLHLLWWWAMDYADDGDLSAFSDDVLADAGQWDGEPAAFVGAMEAAGFLDDRMIHDWWEYAGKLIDRRERNKARMRNARAVHVPSTERARAVHVQDTCVARVQLPNPTIPNPTVPPTAKAVVGAEAPATAPGDEGGRLQPPRQRAITESVLAELQAEHPDIDVRAVATDYLNWSGSSKHRDKVVALRNQLRMPQVRERFARRGAVLGGNGHARASPMSPLLEFAGAPPREGGSTP